MSKDRLVPDYFRAFIRNEKIFLRNPKASRPWQHVLEPLCGYLLLAERLAQDPASYSTAWNFGPDLSDVKPVSWIVDRMVSAWGADASWALEGTSHPHEASLLAVDATLARSRLQWRPRFALQEGLERTVSWYRQQAAGRPASELIADDINCYMNK